jgi:hypothetical protein
MKKMFEGLKKFCRQVVGKERMPIKQLQLLTALNTLLLAWVTWQVPVSAFVTLPLASAMWFTAGQADAWREVAEMERKHREAVTQILDDFLGATTRRGPGPGSTPGASTKLN